jgi:hypothetical protein
VEKGCTEKQEQLRCLDYIEGQGKLFVGTNSSVILTIDISELLAMPNVDFGDAVSSPKKEDMGATGEGFQIDEEEYGMGGSEDGDSPNQSPNQKGDYMAQIEALKKDN